MKLLRIIEKETHLFLRDDFTFDEETEIGLNVEPAQGLYAPKWGGEITEDEDGNLVANQDGQWIETGQAPEPIPQVPSEVELLMLAVAELADIVMGG